MKIRAATVREGWCSASVREIQPLSLTVAALIQVDLGTKAWIKVIGTAAIRQIDIIKNNRFILTQHPLEKEVNLTFKDRQVEPGTSYYYVRVIQVDDQMAWSSPIWLTPD